MLPRYLPDIGWSSWRHWLAANHPATGEDWQRFRAALGGEELPPHHREFDTLRTALVQYFSSVRRRVGTGSILVSAQICAAVPLAIERAGLAVEYVDLADSHPTPGASEFAGAINETTLGVLVAPFYGHLQGDWSPLIAALGGRILVLDMAQGLGLEGRVAPLVRRADAVGYSFGLGKGLDTGGGLLLTRAEPDMPALPRRSKAACAEALIKTIALHAMIRMGGYGLVVSRLDSIDAGDQSVPEHGTSAPADVCRLWGSRLPRLLDAIALARRRAQALAASPALAAGLRDAATCFDAEASHLRQLIRVRDATRRDALVSRLRATGVDCAPGGERLPALASAAERFPRAAAFRREAVRLPFLGRLTDTQFADFRETLERAVVHCLH